MSNLTNMTNQSLSADEGYCDDWTPWALLPFFAFVLLFVVLLIIDFATKLRPSRGSVSYGRPWGDVHLLFFLAARTLLPAPLIYFFYYHVWTSERYETVGRVACLEVYGNFPVIPLFFVVQSLARLFIYNPAPYVRQAAALLFPDGALNRLATATGGHRPTVAIIGGTARGTLYLEIVKRVVEQYRLLIGMPLAKPRFVLVDVASWREWVFSSAEAMNLSSDIEVVSMGPLRNDPGAQPTAFAQPHAHVMHPTTATAAPRPTPAFVPFALAAFADDQVDEVVLLPELRETVPLKDYAMSPIEATRRMRLLLAEALRVLRPGGTVRVCEGLLEVLAYEEELRSVGFDIKTTTCYTGQRLGPVFFMRHHQYSCEGVKPLASAVALPHAAGVTSSVMSVSPLLDQKRHGGVASVSIAAPCLEPRREWRAGAAVVLVTQLAVFVAVVLVASLLANPLWFPSSVSPSMHVSMLVMNVAIFYAMFGYFSRRAAFLAGPSISVVTLFTSALLREVVAVATAAGFACMLFLPQLVALLALDSAPSAVRDAVPNIASFLFSALVIGLVLRRRLTVALVLANCSKERFEMLVKDSKTK